MTITNSTISGNLARGDAGGVGVLYGNVTIRHSTVTANQADSDSKELSEELGRAADAALALERERDSFERKAAGLSAELADSRAATAAAGERNRALTARHEALAHELAELRGRRWTRLGSALRAIPPRN
jgi:septal ring factor EnvC (AmiA/AmiB activator)